MSIQKTFVLVKPDGVQRRLVGEVIQRFERKGLKICALKMLRVTKNMAKEHYKEHIGKEFYEPLIKFITSAPVVAMVVEGAQAIPIVRKMAGKTNFLESEPGSIRGDFSLCTRYNIVHSADSVESANREMNIYFKPEEIVNYQITNEIWFIDEDEN